MRIKFMENIDIVYGKNAIEGLLSSERASRVNKILVSQNIKKEPKMNKNAIDFKKN